MMLVPTSSQVIFLLFLHPLAFLPACIFLLTQTASVTFPAPTLNHEAGITNQQQSPKGLSENIHSYSSFLPASPVQNIIFRASHMKLPNSEFIIKSKQHNLITLRLVSDPLLKIGRKKKKKSNCCGKSKLRKKNKDNWRASVSELRRTQGRW